MSEGAPDVRSQWFLRLGYGGLIPFLALAGGAHLLDGMWQTRALEAQVAYAAVIASFIGALHWGANLAAVQPRTVGAIVWSVVPSLLAWLLLLVPLRFGLAGFFLLFPLLWWVDRHLHSDAAFLRLRTTLTLVATLSLAVSLAA
jgi:hypothetical protein